MSIYAIKNRARLHLRKCFYRDPREKGRTAEQFGDSFAQILSHKTEYTSHNYRIM